MSFKQSEAGGYVNSLVLPSNTKLLYYITVEPHLTEMLSARKPYNSVQVETNEVFSVSLFHWINSDQSFLSGSIRKIIYFCFFVVEASAAG